MRDYREELPASIIDYFSFKHCAPVTGEFRPDVVKRIEAGRWRAKRYIFDENASVYLSELIHTDSKRIILNAPHALMPSEDICLEWDLTRLREREGEQSRHGPMRHGILILGHEMFLFWHYVAGSLPMICHFGVREGTGSNAELQQVFKCDLSLANQLGRFALLGGGVAQEGRDRWGGRALTGWLPKFDLLPMPTGIDADQFCAQFSFFEVWKAPERLAPFSAISHRGFLIHKLAMLLLLNDPKAALLTPQAPKRSMKIGKHKKHTQHSFNLVTINIAATTRLTLQAGAPLGIKHRRHAVRGHWVTVKPAPGCSHDFEAVAGCESRRLRCKQCDAVRFWRKAHQRGDASLGTIKKEYQVRYE